MSRRTVGLWLYRGNGGEQIEQKLIAGLRERDIDCLSGLNLRYAEAHSGGIFLHNIHMDELDLFLSCNVAEQSRYQLYFYELLDRHVPFVNSFKAFSVARDRMKTSIALKLGGVPHADFYLCHRYDKDKLRAALCLWDSRAIFKPVDSWSGMQITPMQSQNDIDRIMPFLNQLDIRYFYIEKLIDFDGTDYRVEVVDGEAIACYVRRNEDGDWCSNARSLGSASVYGMNADLAELAVRAAAALELDIAAVDIIFDREREDYVVIDIDASPPFATPEQEALGLDFNARKIERIVELIDRKTR